MNSARKHFASVVCLLLAATAQGEVSARRDGTAFLIENPDQRLVWKPNAAGEFILVTYTRRAGEWQPVFDGGAPLVQGTHFDQHPTACEIVAPGPDRAALRLTGKHPSLSYAWSVAVETRAGTPWVAFEIACDLPAPITLAGLEPQVALWSTDPSPAVTLDQGPGNIYRGAADGEWGNSFPAAYRWRDDIESAVFFDAASMDWMSSRNLFRFRDCRVQSWTETGRAGFGLRVVRRNFHELSAGKVAWRFHLHSAERKKSPTRSEALHRLLELAGPLHPARAEPMLDRLTGAPVSWTKIAREVSANLMLKDIVWTDVPLPPDAPWRDGPAFPEHTVTTLRVSTDYAVDSACDPAAARKAVRDGWDFSTFHNYLAGWLAHDRLHPNPERRDFLAAKLRTVPLFFDPETQMFRHRTRLPATLGPKEMSWQNFAFAIEVDKIRRVLPPRDRDPALAGKFVRGAQSLADFAHAVDYLFPQWFDPVRKTALAQGDEPALGIIHEPWQTGSFAWIMCAAHEIDGDPRFLNEARMAIDRLLGGIRFRVKNERYDIEYTDPVDFPVTEIFGNAWGAAAGAKLHALTSDDRFLRASDAFLDGLLRMTYWYESDLRDDPRDRAVRMAGLIRNHSGAYTGSPWENGEAYLALTVRLRADLLRGATPREPLLRMFNTYRINSATFFPPVFTKAAQPCERLMQSPAHYLPIEDTYTLEHGGLNGGMGRAAYMSGIAFWNELMFEALATASDPELLVLNLDAIEKCHASLASLQRHFVVYNPSATRRTAKLAMKHLALGEYRIAIAPPGAKPSLPSKPADATQLAAGIELSLGPGQHTVITLEHVDLRKGAAELHAEESTANRLAREYQRLQSEAAAEAGADFATRKAVYLKERDSFMGAQE